jgi:hypothetical protein
MPPVCAFQDKSLGKDGDDRYGCKGGPLKPA